MSGVTARPPRPHAPAAPSRAFEAACRRVVDHLRRHVPLAFWSVSRHVDDQQVHIHVHDEFYGTSSGHAQPWSESFCRHVVDGSAPCIAPDVREVPEFAGAAGIGAYVGVPIRDVDGSVFGMICGVDPRPHPHPEQLHAHRPLLDVLAELLEQILHADHLRIEAAAREAELHWRAHHDHLTGLANRAGFLQRLTDLQRTGRHRPTAVLLIDLDDFKAVNDTFGHTGGDELLVLVADRIRGVLDAADLLARLGGDEFAVIVHRDEPEAVAARVVAALQHTVTLAGRRIRLSATVGVAELGPKGSTGGVDNAVARADTAMYQAKRAGKGRYVVFDPSMALPASVDLAFGEPLRHAITTGEVRAAYQPIVTLPDRAVVGFEALARWPYGDDLVRPGLFIPVAARLGLLPALTDHMLDTAVRRLVLWNAQLGHEELRVGINVSPLCMGDHDFPDRVAEGLRRHGIHPGQLTLEITEEALLHDLPTATAVAGRLNDLGVLLALDDFGTGYSSLLHLRQIPLRAMKVDRGFLRDIDTDVDTALFVKALLTFGADLGIAVVVEGVERESQAEVLADLGCTLAQGHLFGPPAPAESWDLSSP